MNITYTSLSKSPNSSSVSLEIGWSSFVPEASVTVEYTATCGADTVCTNETVLGITETNVTLNNLVPGVAHRLMIWGKNRVGKGLARLLEIEQDKMGNI